jgi:hypothetical protein
MQNMGMTMSDEMAGMHPFDKGFIDWRLRWYGRGI